MNRLFSSITLDFTLQIRNNLYTIGIAVSCVLAIILAWLVTPYYFPWAIPTVILSAIGGSTFFYVAAMILFEKDETTLHAISVSPLRISEYLWSKIITLTALATLESSIMVVGATLITSYSHTLKIPNISALLLGTITIGALYTLLGIIIVVRYQKITDFIISLWTLLVALIFQLPFLYFLDITDNPLLLIIPTSAPTMIIRGAYIALHPWQWVYALIYTALSLILFSFWAYRAFRFYIIFKQGHAS